MYLFIERNSNENKNEYTNETDNKKLSIAVAQSEDHKWNTKTNFVLWGSIIAATFSQIYLENK